MQAWRGSPCRAFFAERILGERKQRPSRVRARGCDEFLGRISRCSRSVASVNLLRKSSVRPTSERSRDFRGRVAAINALESEVEVLSDDELRARTELFRQQLKDG